jgi:hypothetical protein
MAKLWCGSEGYEVVVKLNELKVTVKCKCNCPWLFVYYYCYCLVYNTKFHFYYWSLMNFINFCINDWGAVLQARRPWVRLPMNQLNIIHCTWAFQPHHNPKVCSASIMNEYKKIFRKIILGSKMGSASNLTAIYKFIIQFRCLITQ